MRKFMGLTKRNLLVYFKDKGAILFSLLTSLIVLVLQFFIFNVDYSRAEYVQFEDDEYYYYVKAVPKIVLHERQPRSKNINRSRSAEGGHDSGEMTKERERATRSANHDNK